MEAQIKAKKLGGSIGIIIPREIVEKERIREDDILNVKVEKTDDITFLRGVWKDVKKPTQKIMEEIDEGED